MLIVKGNPLSRLHKYEIENRTKHRAKSINKTNTSCKDKVLEYSTPSWTYSGTSVSWSQRGFHCWMLHFCSPSYFWVCSHRLWNHYLFLCSSFCSVLQRLDVPEFVFPLYTFLGANNARCISRMLLRENMCDNTGKRPRIENIQLIPRNILFFFFLSPSGVTPLGWSGSSAQIIW